MTGVSILPFMDQSVDKSMFANGNQNLYPIDTKLVKGLFVNTMYFDS